MLEIYTIYGGGMWKTALDAIVTLIGSSTFSTLLRMASTFGVLAALVLFIKQHNPMVFVHWLAVFMIISTVLLVPKRSVQVIDISDPGAVWKTNNVPVGLAGIASLSTSIGYRMSSLYDSLMARPDSVTYSRTGMLFGSQIVAETSDFTTQNPELAQMLPDYVENCVIGDILLNGKYSINELLNSTDPLTLITSNPSPLRGIFKMTSSSRQFLTCQQAAAEIKTLANIEANLGSATFTWLTQKIFGNKVNGATLLANAMGDSYGYFYAAGMSAAQIMKNNITNTAVRQGIKGFAARSSDTANLLNLATENAATKQRLSWASGTELATRTLPFAQSLLMLILVCLFPLMIALAATSHSLFGLTTLKIYVGGFIYFQMWPIMFAILNYASNYWLQSKTDGTLLVLANRDIVALQHSDVANLAGYLSLSIPVLSYYLTRGAAVIGSQVAGGMLSSAAFTAAGVSSTTADGNWSFNNMSMDNVNQNKMDTNLVQRQGQQTWQADNGSSQTMTAGGHTVIDGSGAMSNLPVNMRLSQLASSGFQESARQSQVQAQTALDGYNHSVTSGWSQLSQVSNQTGTSDSLTQGSENSQVANATRGASMMMSAAESYAKANNISTQEAYNELMSKSSEMSVNGGVSVKVNSGDQALGKVGKWVTGASVEGHGGVEAKGASGSSHGTQETHSNSHDMRHDKNSQTVNDFRQGMDMVTSSRVTDGSSHAQNAATSNVQQFAATLNDAQSQYHQYTTSSTNSSEFSRMATLAQNQSASLDTNYTQEFVDWAANKYGDKAQSILTSAPSAREAAMEFVNERLKPEIMGDYHQGRSDLQSGAEHPAFSGAHIVHTPSMSNSDSGGSVPAGGQYSPANTQTAGQGHESPGGGYDVQRDRGYPSEIQSSQEYEQSGSRISPRNYTGQPEQHYDREEGNNRGVSGGSAPYSGPGSDVTEAQYQDQGHASENGSSGYIHTRSGTVIRGENITGNDMQDVYRENQMRLHSQSGQGVGPQNELQRQVAGQRSEIERNMNKSAGEIDKKQSTVQASSDILKGEEDNVKSQFREGKIIEDLRQKDLPILHSNEIDEHKKNLEVLRGKGE
ncbi:conjugal transfer mating pair stabilization protein TraG [Citrobacter braakii]|uniref:Conjugal transfer mating pair stabilization protein TraG n=1 Tax=Citrobacter braakii TaxID=57706 RepID=A0A8I0KT17_CITBR|nr:conjugal transfer mating-pair stabilization protein TraG [Citrobacter braakii]EIV2910325.1 conjugal transfer mating pair stabilization protein TraG [Citrobacter braakii]MBD3125871.1 conjugal transfer mating pair stabilization protein TraG [Citrobacter braakii]